MKIQKRTILLFLIALLLLSATAIKPFIPLNDVLVSAKATPGKIHVGDNIKYTITVKAPRDAEIKFLEIEGDELGNFHIRSKKTIKKNIFSNKQIRRDCDLTIYRPGTHRIPASTIYYRLSGTYSWCSIGVPSFSIEVKPLVTIDLEAERRIKIGGSSGLAGEMKEYGSSGMPGSGGGSFGRGMSGGNQGRFIEAPIRYFINEVRPHRDALTYKDIVLRGVLGLVGLGVLIIAIIIIGGIILCRREPAPPIPHKIALKELRRLKGEKLTEADSKEFYARLSAILKKYLRSRFEMKPAELPIEDFTNELSTLKELVDDDKKYVIERLRMYEIYKYSEISVGKTDMELALKTEEEFINKTAEEEGDDV